MILSDDEFEKLKRGDKILLTRLYEALKSNVNTYFSIKTFGNKTVADDLTHETFCAIIESVHKLKNAEGIRYWVLTIARNKLVEYQRRLYRNQKYMKIIAEKSNEEEDMVEKIHAKQKALLLKLAVDSLNTEYKKIYQMRFVKGQKMKEIAAHLQKTIKAVDNIITRIRQHIKKEMKRLANDFF